MPVPYIDSLSEEEEEEEECMPYGMSSSSQDDFEKPSKWTHKTVSSPIVISNEPFRVSSENEEILRFFPHTDKKSSSN